MSSFNKNKHITTRNITILSVSIETDRDGFPYANVRAKTMTRTNDGVYREIEISCLVQKESYSAISSHLVEGATLEVSGHISQIMDRATGRKVAGPFVVQELANTVVADKVAA